ncbi:TniQ family protein [Roseateles albus]|uniref:TniQ family protein n=1 Tax=Roseateles albus TaxID=2987525 RepID=A0ABT5KEI6_9BURK|nr:TniQ family protein [Roseateles albus]MDC8772347.1 TniQ family protein [Roseateles albus]
MPQLKSGIQSLHRQLPLNVPTLLPDECGKGFIGRVFGWNGAVDHLSMDIWRKSGWGRHYSPFEFLIEVTGLPRSTLICEHTHLPYFRFVNKTFAGSSYDCASTDVASCSRLHTLNTPRGNARLCEKCVLKDLSEEGVSYWRRTHQLHGISHCAEHGHPLLTAECNHALLSPPSQFLDSGETRPIAPSILQAAAGPFIKRFVALSAMTLTMKAPRHPAQLSRSLEIRARHHGIRVSPQGRVSNLSDRIIEMAAGPWLDENFPILKNKRPAEFVSAIDGTCISRHVAHHTVSYLLAMAALWDTTDEAMTACFVTEAPGVAGHDAQEELRQQEAAFRLFLKDVGVLRAIKAHNLSKENLSASMQHYLRRAALESK